MSVTQYNHSAITNTKTVHGDINTLNASTLTEIESLVNQIFISGGGDPDYLTPLYFLANGTDGALPPETSIPYPTGYIGISNVYYVTRVSAPATICPVPDNLGCGCPWTSIQMPGFYLPGGVATSSLLSLRSVYYEANPTGEAGDWEGHMQDSVNLGFFNNTSFSEWLLSDATLRSRLPLLQSCSFPDMLFGPPAMKIPVSAMTATVTASTVQASMTPQVAAPASPVKPASAPKTSQPTPPNSQPSTRSSLDSSASPLENTIVESHGTRVDQGTTSAALGTPSQGILPINTLPSQNVDPVSNTEGSTPGTVAFGGSHAEQTTDTSGRFVEGTVEKSAKTAVPQRIPVVTFHGSSHTADASSAFYIEGQRLTPGGAVTADSTIISLPSAGNALVVGTQTSSLYDTPHPQLIFTYGGSTYAAEASSGFYIEGQRLTPGGAVTADSTTISMPSAGNAIVIGTQASPLYAAHGQAPARHIFTFGGSTYTADTGSDFVIAGKTLDPANPITIDGTMISFQASGNNVVVGSSTQHMLTFGGAPHPTKSPLAVMTFEGSTYTANPASAFVIDGQTLTQGGTITIDGTRIAYAQDSSDVIIGSSTQYLSPRPEITFAGSTYIANSASEFIIDGQTLTEGGTITVQETPVLYASDGADVVFASSTETINVGNLIMSGFGPSTPPAGNASVVAFTGAAVRHGPMISYWIVVGCSFWVACVCW